MYKFYYHNITVIVKLFCVPLSATLWSDSQRTRTVLGRRVVQSVRPCDVERSADRTAYCYCVSSFDNLYSP